MTDSQAMVGATPGSGRPDVSKDGNSRITRNERLPLISSSTDYDTPAAYRNLEDIQTPVQNPDDAVLRHNTTREDRRSHVRRGSVASSRRESRMIRRQSAVEQTDYNVPDQYANLDELAAGSPVQNPDEAPVYRHESLEDTRSREQEDEHRRKSRPEQAAQTSSEQGEKPRPTVQISRLATHVYTLSYLVLFSLLGTLARLGLQALTSYPGAPVIFSSIWPNFAGSLVMGFLSEDRVLFSREWGVPTYANEMERARRKDRDEESGSDSVAAELAAAKKAYTATKKTIPLYIGLATGFCGSFTSFSSFVRDVFLALSNDLTTPGVDGVVHRNGGYSFMALLAVVLLTVSMSLSGLFIGAHIAIATEPFIPAIPYPLTRKVLDRIAVILGWGCWLGAVLLSALPPDRDGPGPETWRGRATFALVFAPLGCLGRFYASLYLNGKVASFPLGTFTVNMFGTAVLGMAWVLAHVPLGGVVGCQVLQGIEDGFCGCLTTVSTWVAELSSLRRRHAYTYGAASVLTALALMVAIMGGLRWSRGFEDLQCLH